MNARPIQLTEEQLKRIEERAHALARLGDVRELLGHIAYQDTLISELRQDDYAGEETPYEILYKQNERLRGALQAIQRLAESVDVPGQIHVGQSVRQVEKLGRIARRTLEKEATSVL